MRTKDILLRFDTPSLVFSNTMEKKINLFWKNRNRIAARECLNLMGKWESGYLVVKSCHPLAKYFPTSLEMIYCRAFTD